LRNQTTRNLYQDIDLIHHQEMETMKNIIINWNGEKNMKSAKRSGKKIQQKKKEQQLKENLDLKKDRKNAATI
jgi:uncharacterized membrane protein